MSNQDPTHCACCRMPLTDAVSVNRGIGPICSAKYYDPPAQAVEDFGAAGRELLNSGLVEFKNLGERMSVAGDLFEYSQDIAATMEIVGEFNSRSVANKLINAISKNREDDGIQIPLVGALNALGYKNLSEVICKRIGKRRMRRYERGVVEKAKAPVIIPQVSISFVNGDLYVRAPYNEGFNGYRRGAGRWNGVDRAHVFMAEKRVELWGAIREHYSGAHLYVSGVCMGLIDKDN